MYNFRDIPVLKHCKMEISLCHRIECKACAIFMWSESTRRALEVYSLDRMFTNLQNVYFCLTRFIESNMKFISYVTSKGIENIENPSECFRKEYNFGCIISVLKIYAVQPLEFSEYLTASKKLMAGREANSASMEDVKQTLERTTMILKYSFPYQSFLFIQLARRLKGNLAKKGFFTTAFSLERLCPFSQLNWLSLLPIFCRKLDILYCRPTFSLGESLKQPPPFSNLFMLKFKNHLYVLMLSFLAETLYENQMKLKLNRVNSLFPVHRTLPQHRGSCFFIDNSFYIIYDENVTEMTFLKICLNIFNSKNFASFNLTKMLAYFLKSNAVQETASPCASPLCKRRKTQ